jgi:tellurite resistance protein TerC
LSAVLGFVGIKMLVVAVGIKIPIALSLTVVVGILTISILASVIAARRESKLGVVSDETVKEEAS